MGNRFGIHGLEATSVHSKRDVDAGRISDRPIEVPVTESRSEFGSSCPDPEVSQTKFQRRHIPILRLGGQLLSLSHDTQPRRIAYISTLFTLESSSNKKRIVNKRTHIHKENNTIHITNIVVVNCEKYKTEKHNF